MRRGILITVLAALLAVVVVMMRSVRTEEPLAGVAPALEPGSAVAAVTPTRRAIELAPVEALPPEPEPEPGQTRPEGRDGGPAGAPGTSAGKPDDAEGGESGAATPFVVSGRVTAVDGTATKAHVSLIMPNGSIGFDTDDDGAFEFAANQPPQNIHLGPGSYALLATAGELVAVYGGIQLTTNNPSPIVDLILEPGGKLELVLKGTKQSARCRLLSSGIVIDDFTLRNEEAAQAIVPVGPILLQLYEGETIFEERSLQGMPGEQETVELHVDA